MANYQLLKADIDAKVYENAYRKITGENLNSVLNAMVTTLGAEYQFAGVATKDTNPEISDAKVFYIANGKGIYTNFGGINVTEDDVVVLYWDSSWHKESTGIAREEILTELGKEVATKQNALTDTDGGYGQRVAELEKEGIASQEKLSELETEVYGTFIDKTIPFSDFTVQDIGVVVAYKVNYGTEINTAGWYCTDYIAIPDGITTIKYLGGANANTFGIAFYDENKSPNAPNPFSTDYWQKRTN